MEIEFGHLAKLEGDRFVLHCKQSLSMATVAAINEAWDRFVGKGTDAPKLLVVDDDMKLASINGEKRADAVRGLLRRSLNEIMNGGDPDLITDLRMELGEAT